MFSVRMSGAKDYQPPQPSPSIQNRRMRVNSVTDRIVLVGVLAAWYFTTYTNVFVMLLFICIQRTNCNEDMVQCESGLTYFIIDPLINGWWRLKGHEWVLIMCMLIINKTWHTLLNLVLKHIWVTYIQTALFFLKTYSLN